MTVSLRCGCAFFLGKLVIIKCCLLLPESVARQLMEERNWTDYRLAKEANLSHSTVTNMFNRNNAPTLPTLEAVCRAFGITLAQFFAEGEEVQLTEEQQKLFSKWSTLTDRQKQILLELMDAI